MNRKIIALSLSASLLLSLTSCEQLEALMQTEETAVTAESEASVSESQETSEPTETEADIEIDLNMYAGMTAEEITASLTLEQKADQMVQCNITEVDQEDMEQNCYGSVLSHYDNPFSTEEWNDVIDELQTGALMSDAAIPYIYGQDSVHGVNFSSDTVIFPHNINIGATRDVEGARQMGIVVGNDIMPSNMIWNFAPCVAVARDPRWGRTYESYSSEPEIVSELAAAYTEGLVEAGVVACPKHFIGDGYTVYGTGEASDVTRLIDRGDAQMTEEQIEANLAIYQAQIEAGAQSIMLSHSSLNGVKMHENAELISRLRNELGFEGVILSDWESIHNISGTSLEEQVINCINAGCDMLMEPYAYDECVDIIIAAAEDGRIPMERIDEAVTRIIQLKIDAGLIEDPYLDDIEPVACEEYSYDLALRLAEESLVPLKDDAGLVIPDGSLIYVSGPAADDTGVLCGGWTYTWTGMCDSDIGGMKFVPNCTTILEGLEEMAEEHNWTITTDKEEIMNSDYVVLCVGERPYAEWLGDTEDLSVTGALGLDSRADIELAAASDVPTITLIVAGRNVIIDDYMDDWDSIIMCYLPGSTGGTAIANCLAGEAEYTGTLPMPYYENVAGIERGEYLFPVGYSCVQ
ncbi:MAG: glycoside hydrolase family 3 C-terminal domain-containing protein [Saccharofermentans sp.]|nr:glycoside hydrolase family 3 C-terminal domain-containing protein [Saccharofermentans sp.]